MHQPGRALPEVPSRAHFPPHGEVMPAPASTWAVWAGIAGAVFVLSLLFPPTGDDWRRIAFPDKTWGGYLDQALVSYAGHNGRIVGNSISFILMEPVWLRAASKAATVTALVVALQVATRARSAWAALASFAGVFLMPAGLFRESYVWSAGFFNYVPPLVAVLLLVAALGVGGGPTPGGRHWPRFVGAFVMASVACLFVEHVTVALLALALVGVAAALVVRQAPMPALVGCAAGAVAGTVVMFASPGLRDVAAGEDAYFSYASSSGDLIEKTLTNYAVITGSFVLSNPVLLLLTLAAVLGCLWSRERRVWVDGAAAVAMVVIAGYALVSRLLFPDALRCPTGPQSCSPGALLVDVLALFALLGVLVVVGLRRLAPGRDRRVWFALLGATLLMLGPLLVVAPIGPRNIFGPSVTLAALAVLLGRAALDEVGRPRLVRSVTVVLVAMVALGLAGLLLVNGSNALVASERVRLMEAAVEGGGTRVELPAFPYPSWVHDANDPKIGNRYFHVEPRDIETVFP